MKHLLTASRLVKFQRCARAHHYRYELGVAPVQSAPALAFGTAIHAALEAFWRAWMTDGYGSTESALDALLACGLDPLSLVKAQVMVSAYCARYMMLAARSTVLAVEVEFSAPLVDPDSGVTSGRWLLAGKIDAIVRLPDGRVAIVEHKSSGRDASAGSDYRARLTLDAQVGIYFDGAEALGYAADLCLYDVLVKPSMEPALATPPEERKYTKPKSRACRECAKKAPAPGPHFDEKAQVFCVDGQVQTDPGGVLYANLRDRDETAEEYAERLMAAVEADPDRYLVQAELVRTAEERDDCRRDVAATVRAIELNRRQGYAPRSAQSCFVHGRCEYLDACHAPSMIDDPYRYRRLPIHQELSEVTAHNPNSPKENAA